MCHGARDAPLEKAWQRHYAGFIFSAPMNDVEALTLALRLAVTAPTEEKAALALEHAAEAVG